ncbi:hypothetical protein BH10PAT2_BH10PAT2_4270 [soil metagenome]
MELNSVTLSFMLILTGLTGVVLALGFAYHNMLKQFQALSKSQRHFQDKSFHQAEEVLDDAHQQALATIQQANQKASHLISLGGAFSEEQKGVLSKQMKITSEEELNDYKVSLQQSQQELRTSLGQVSDELQRAAEAELTQFRHDLVKSTTETQGLFAKQLQSELGEAESDVKQYKKELLDKANAHMFQVVQQVVQEVLHKSLTKTEHEALVIEALEEAKKHHVL